MGVHEKAWLPDFLYTGGRLENGLAMVVDQTGHITRLSRQPQDLAGAERIRNRAIFPGFVNAHSHAFQRTIRGRTEYRTQASKDTFWTWRDKMYQAAQALTPDGIYASARMVFMEMLLAGITTVGEFHYLHHAPGGTRYDDLNLLAKTVVRAARDVGLRIALLQTAYARAGWKNAPNPGQTRFLYRSVTEFCDELDALRTDLDTQYRGDQVWLGIAPHSLRAVPLDNFCVLNQYGRDHGMPVHMHVSEQREENEQCLAENGKTPVALLAGEGLLHGNFTAIHCVHLSDAEIGALGAAGTSVCACPTTERNLGDGIVPARDLLNAGVNLALGSDSQIQIDPLEDARQLEYHLRLLTEERAVLAPRLSESSDDPDGLAQKLLYSATVAGAQSLRAPVGVLGVGHPADFFTVDLRDPSIAGAGNSLAAIVFGLQRTAICDVAVAGRMIVRDGRHPSADEIVDHFDNVQRELWSKP
jgi:formimidoylglutamate deiminase